MKFNIFKRCKHNWSIVHHIGGDMQNTAYECDKCNKHKVVSYGSAGKLSYEEIIEIKIAQDRVISARRKYEVLDE